MAQVCQIQVSVPPLGTRGGIITNLEQRFRYIYPHIPRAKTSHIPIELLRFVVV